MDDSVCPDGSCCLAGLARRQPALWSWLFLAWHHGALAFADILLLWALIVATPIAFWKIRPLARVLLVPYLLWVTFAATLNYAVWQLNPRALG